MTIPVVNATFFNGCQVKALVGGLLVGAGGVILLVGFVLLAKDTAAGRAVKGLTPIGRASNALGSRAPATATATAAPEVESETSDEYDRGYADAASSAPAPSSEERKQFKNTKKAATGGDRGPIPRRNTQKKWDLAGILNEPAF